MAARKLKRSEQLPPTSPYELLIRLASGGMGAVYLGVRRGTSQPLYAIKRPHAHLAEETDFRKMFVTEARLAHQIRHSHAVGVLDVDETDGELLMVMNYVEGGSLAELLGAAQDSGRRIPAAVALRIVADAARGLDAAHNLRDARGAPLGIVHRDVSPQNILVGLDGRASIVDFGVAKAAGVEATRTASDILKGKTAYMAPEYVVDRLATPQSDVFSLGVVCWEVLANRRLFKGADDVETMRRLVDPAPATMLSDVTTIDISVSAIVARALAKDPSKRFHSAAELADALEAKALAAQLLATPREVSTTLFGLLSESLEERRALVTRAMSEMGIGPPLSDLRRTGKLEELNTTVELGPNSVTAEAQTSPYTPESASHRAPTVPMPRSVVAARSTLPLTPLAAPAAPLPSRAKTSYEPATLIAVQTAASFEPRPQPKTRGIGVVSLTLGALVAGATAVVLLLFAPEPGPRDADATTPTAERPASSPHAVAEPDLERESAPPLPATSEAIVSASAASLSASAPPSPARVSQPNDLGPASSARPSSVNRPVPTNTSTWKPKANPY